MNNQVEDDSEEIADAQVAADAQVQQLQADGPPLLDTSSSAVQDHQMTPGFN